MIYTNSVYEIFNPAYIDVQYREQHNADQMIKTIECANKLREFLESVDKVEPAYQAMSMEACCCVLAEYIKMREDR